MHDPGAPRRKPLYPGAYAAFSPFDRIALAQLIGRIRRPAPRLLEVGSWLGNGSTAVFIEQLRPSGCLYCVDTWAGSANVPRHQEIAAQFDVLATFLHQVALAGGTDIVHPMIMTSARAAALVADHSLDLVFIDADHGYEAVKADIQCWRGKVAAGGILCGHDCEIRATRADIPDLQAGRQLDVMPWKAPFPFIHPGPALAVHEAFGDDVELFSEQPIVLPDGTPGRSTLWAVTVR